MKLKDLKDRNVKYDWKTIFVGIKENYFSGEIVVDYALEIIQSNDNDDFANEILLGTFEDKLNDLMMEIYSKYCIRLNYDVFEKEDRKLRFVFLDKLNKIYNGGELLDKITEFYDNHHYPKDLSEFINYMPQKETATREKILDNFCLYLKREKAKVMLIN